MVVALKGLGLGSGFGVIGVFERTGSRSRTGTGTRARGSACGVHDPWYHYVLGVAFVPASSAVFLLEGPDVD